LFLESLRRKAILIASLDGYKPTHPHKKEEGLAS
jgi:hypothetical protein